MREFKKRSLIILNPNWFLRPLSIFLARQECTKQSCCAHGGYAQQGMDLPNKRVHIVLGCTRNYYIDSRQTILRWYAINITFSSLLLCFIALCFWRTRDLHHHQRKTRYSICSIWQLNNHWHLAVVTQLHPPTAKLNHLSFVNIIYQVLTLLTEQTRARGLYVAFWPV